MWLRLDHPWRKRKDLFNGEEELGRAPRPRSGEEIYELLENWEECPAPGKKRPRESLLLGVWKLRSVFWDLPYWKVLHTPLWIHRKILVSCYFMGQLYVL
jgi:hypothetical protein